MPGTKSASSRSTVEQCDELRRKMQLMGMDSMFFRLKKTQCLELRKSDFCLLKLQVRKSPEYL